MAYLFRHGLLSPMVRASNFLPRTGAYTLHKCPHHSILKRGQRRRRRRVFVYPNQATYRVMPQVSFDPLLSAFELGVRLQTVSLTISTTKDLGLYIYIYKTQVLGGRVVRDRSSGANTPGSILERSGFRIVRFLTLYVA